MRGPDDTDTALLNRPRSAARGAEGGGRVGGDDAELMRAACGGDREAYGTLFRRHGAGFWRMAYLLLHDSAAADDALQEAFVRGLAALGTWQDRSGPRSWFYTIVLNVCRESLRNEGARAARAADAAREPVVSGVITSVLRRERGRHLALALGYLNEAQREAFVLHYVQDLPYDEVASLLGLRPGAARALAFRACRILREKMGSDPLFAARS